MNIRQAETSFREIMSMYEDNEIGMEEFVFLLLNINIEKVVTYNAEEYQKKEELQKIIEEELKRTE